MAPTPKLRLDRRCRAILQNRSDTRPFRRCDSTEVLAHGYCETHAYPAFEVRRFAAMWLLLGEDWERVQDGIGPTDLPDVESIPGAPRARSPEAVANAAMGRRLARGDTKPRVDSGQQAPDLLRDPWLLDNTILERADLLERSPLFDEPPVPAWLRRPVG